MRGHNINTLHRSDVDDIFDQIKDKRTQKTSYYKSVFCFKRCRNKEKEFIHKKKAVQRFDEHLDIRSFLSVYTDLSLALNVLLNK